MLTILAFIELCVRKIAMIKNAIFKYDFSQRIMYGLIVSKCPGKILVLMLNSHDGWALYAVGISCQLISIIFALKLQWSQSCLTWIIVSKDRWGDMLIWIFIVWYMHDLQLIESPAATKDVYSWWERKWKKTSIC